MNKEFKSEEVMSKAFLPRIVEAAGRLLVGVSISMSMVNNRTGELWRAFSPRIKEVENRKGSDKFSLQVYPPGYFLKYDPSMKYTKWALVEVDDKGSLPESMSEFQLPGGTYAVFDFVGDSREAFTVFQYIYSKWIPNSGYRLDSRPHFEVLGSKYVNGDPNSEEEIWIPIAPKSITV